MRKTLDELSSQKIWRSLQMDPPGGGILLVGARTAVRDGGGEVLKKICPLDKNPRVADSLAKLV